MLTDEARAAHALSALTTAATLGLAAWALPARSPALGALHAALAGCGAALGRGVWSAAARCPSLARTTIARAALEGAAATASCAAVAGVTGLGLGVWARTMGLSPWDDERIIACAAATGSLAGWIYAARALQVARLALACGTGTGRQRQATGPALAVQAP